LLPNKLQPSHDVIQNVHDVLVSIENGARVFEHLLLYAEFQFGKEIIGKGYRVREDGDRVSNYDIEFEIFYRINRRLSILHRDNTSLSRSSREDMMFPYLDRSLIILNSWLTYLESNASNVIERANYLDEVIMNLSLTEHVMGVVAVNRVQFDVAEGHNQRCLAYSKRLRLEGEEKIMLTFRALRSCSHLRASQGDYSEALTFAEEGYNLVVEAYDPVHPQVQEAAGILIEILIRKGDYYDGQFSFSFHFFLISFVLMFHPC
jgi:hypothetical protein